MRNSSLVEWLCAEDVTGLKPVPKLGMYRKVRGRGALHAGRSGTGRSRGLHARENAGMSSENYVRIIMAENLRFLEEGSSAQGKPGAKARRKRVVDAHTVEIPWPPKPIRYTGTQEHSLTPPLVERGERERKTSSEAGDCTLTRKAVYLVRCPYRKPTQVDEERILRPAGEGLLRNSAN